MEDFGSSARSSRQRTVGSRSRLRFAGWEGQRFVPASRRRRRAHHQWWPQFWGRQLSTASANTEFDSLESNMMSTPTRRCDQMLSVHDAASGDTSPHTTRRPNPSVLSALENTKRQTTGARSKGARWERAAHALMGRYSAPTAEDLTGRERMLARPRGRPGRRPGSGARHPQDGRRRARGPRYPRSEPRPPRGKRRVKRRLLSWGRKGPFRRVWKWRSRGRGLFCFPFLSFPFLNDFIFSLCKAGYGEQEH